ncbi:MAG: protein kinase domain-containing protein [Thermoguttaceae bacterium]
MESAPRYEILDTIATGDFATVYRARDRELGREVAIKQIHQQFLTNPRQLERYWREAQLLASLQHPNVLTIYDIVRSRGWLILELMRGSLQRSAESGPIDLDFLRASLICCLSALDFLHTNGVIHGDVKPSNMLVDAQGRVKLGDFGLARRASSEQGSLLKGTTKYMAPELVSEQFGPVGPASDLYSLGFSAYELLCGPQFESLFPGLSTFGRDRQTAWLLWHAAPDRRLPEIHRVLEGVPDDLAQVIQRLTIKDQARRYHSARSALRDLGAAKAPVGAEPKPEDQTSQPMAKNKRLLRLGAIGALVLSAVFSILVLFWPGRQQPDRTAPPEPVRGVLRDIFLDEQLLVVQESDTEAKKEISFSRHLDKVYINQKEALARELQPDDHVQVEYYRDTSGREFRVIRASRPELNEGRLAAVDASSGRVTVLCGPAGDSLVVRVPEALKIIFNGRETHGGKPVKLADLLKDDRVVVQHIADELEPEQAGRVATGLSVLREVLLEGIIRKVDLARSELTIETADGRSETWPFKQRPAIRLNGGDTLSQRHLEPRDLKEGDQARVSHDTHILRVDAERRIVKSGVVQAVQARLLDVLGKGEDKATSFFVDGQTRITLADEPVELADLRPKDLVEVTHMSAPDAPNPRAMAVSASRPADPTRWALLMAIQKYDDAGLSGLSTPLADARLLRDVLVKRYGVPGDQAVLLEDVSLVRLKAEVPSLLDRVQPAAKLVVYFSGHGFRDEDGQVYLAPREFNRQQMAATGLRFQWLVDVLEQCRAKEKLLLLDACHGLPGIDPARQPSTAEMFQSLEAPPGRAPLRTVTGIASCSEGQRGQVLPDRQLGLFAWSLSEGFSGRADKNRDHRLEPTELFAFLGPSMAGEAARLRQPQTPKLFLPDNRPPRLSEDAKKAIRALAVLLQQDQINPAEVKLHVAAAESLAPNQPEPKLLSGLIWLRSTRRDEAQRPLEQVKIEHPDLLLAYQGLAWLRFERRTYPPGIEELTELVARVPKPRRASEPYPAEVQQVFQWAGQLREFAANEERKSVPESTLARLDAAAAAHGERMAQHYQSGRDRMRRLLEDFDARIAAAPDEATRSRLRIDRRQVSNFMSFPFDTARKMILDGLDR